MTARKSFTTASERTLRRRRGEVKNEIMRAKNRLNSITAVLDRNVAQRKMSPQAALRILREEATEHFRQVEATLD